MTEDNRIPDLREHVRKAHDYARVVGKKHPEAKGWMDVIMTILDGPRPPLPAEAAGNCVGRLCAYERALTEEYPDGIEEDSDTLPDPAAAARRVGDFLRSYGDGRVCVAITPLAKYQIPPLFGRDLQALANLVGRKVDWQCAEVQPEHAVLFRAQRCSLKAGHESLHAWVGKQGSLSTWEAQP